MRHPLLRLLCVGLMLAANSPLAIAGGPCATCAPCAPCQVQYQTVERTIMVPQWTTETRTVNAVEVRAEQRQYTQTVCRMVAETHQESCEINVPKYETVYDTVNYTVCKPVMSTVQKQITVNVPYTETRTGTRQVCKMVASTAKRTVCEDHGSFQQVQQTYNVCCNGCVQQCVRMCNVWVPNIVTREVEYQVMKPVMETVEYNYNVTLCKQEARTIDVQVCNYVQEQKSCQVARTVCTMVKQTVTRNVVTCKPVQEQVTRTCTVPVCVNVQKQVNVPVCTMVAKTIQCQVPVSCCPPPGCGCW